MSRRSFSPEFKLESARLVVDQGYSLSEACKAVGVGPTALRRWVMQLQSERQGAAPPGHRALTAEQQQIQQLQSKIKRIERENDILKKATALLMSDSMRGI